MSERKSKVDIIVEVLGERDPEIQRLVALDHTIRSFAEKAKQGEEDGSLMSVELVAEWLELQNKYYQVALEKKKTMN